MHNNLWFYITKVITIVFYIFYTITITMLLWKELILIRGQPSVARGSSRATCENSTKRMWWLVVTVVCTLWFLRPDIARSLLFYLCPLQSLCHALSSARRQHFPSPSLAGSQTWVSSTTRGRRLTFGGQPLLPHSMGREQGWGHMRANPGFGVFWFIPPLLSKPIFGQPPLGKIFPGLHTG